MASELAKAYVQIIPTSQGLGNKLSEMIGGEAESAGKSGGISIGKGIAAGIGVASAAIGAASAAVGKFASEAVSSYANYEQLVGGVEKLYGDAAGKLEQFANEAYKTSGMSANQYMETATGFSAALIKSLGGDVDKAADMTDVAMRAISDNVNVFGSDMASVQNAFQGFAKENYTMLDNLKLGYGGTKEGMKQLIADAAKASKAQEELGLSVDATSMSFDNIVKAIQVVQYEQGIYNATANEAMTTIEGSAKATKAAWENVITAIGRGEGLQEAFQGLTTSIFGEEEGKGLLNQIIPRIQTTLEGIGDFIQTAAPMIIEKLPVIVSAILPPLIKSATSLVTSLAAVIPDLIAILVQTIVTNLPELVNGIAEGLSAIFPQLAEIFTGLAEMINGLFGWILEHGELVEAIIAAILGGFLAYKTVTGIIQAVSAAQTLLNAVMAANPIGLIVAAIAGLVAAFVTLWNTSDEFREFWTNAWESVKSAFVNVWNTLSDFFTTGIPDLISTIIGWLSDLPNKMAYWAGYAIASFVKFFIDLPNNLKTYLTNAATRVQEFGTNLKTKATEIARNFFNNLINGITSLPGRLAQLGRDLINAIINLPSEFTNIGSNIVSGIWEGIKAGWDWLISSVKSLVDSLVQGAKDALGIASPSKVFEQIGEYTTEGFDKGMENFGVGAMKDVQNAMDEISNVSATVDAIGTSANANTDANHVAPSRSADMSTVESMLQDIKTLLGNGTNVNVSLQGDAQGLFRQVRKEVNQFTKSTGNSPFIAPA